MPAIYLEWIENCMPSQNYQHDLAILVVLYNCRLDASRTLNSLLASGGAFEGKNTRICIWNNGPAEISDFRVFVERLTLVPGLSAAYAEDLRNIPLSKIYNFFLSNVDSPVHLILDHDSALSPNFIDCVFQNKDVDFLVPRIIVEGRSRGPVFNGEVVEHDLQLDLAPTNYFISVGSGLTIYASGLRKLLNRYSDVFDENYALYGVDSSFWFRVMDATRNERFAIACRSSLAHSLSRLENEALSISQFRRKERGLDTGITLRRYPSARRILALAKQIVMRPFMFSPLPSGSPSMAWTLYGLLAGRHPRCNSAHIDASWHD